jgi:hypothetical protein
MSDKEVAKRIVQSIVDDFTDRSGLSDAWDSIDEDIQAEITDTWENIVCEEIGKQ